MPLHGLYTQPGAKGLKGLADFEAWSGRRVAQMLDFTGTATWKHVTTWLPFAEWAKLPAMGVRLELSVTLPDDASLAMCADGLYNEHWNTLASNLVQNGLHGTVIRPIWEFNGTHYRWTTRHKDPVRAAELRADYAGAFRQVASAMRGVAGGSTFTFSWCLMNLIDGKTDYTSAYPGDDVVDHVGVDPYDVDVSTLLYPYRAADKTDRPATDVEIRTAQDTVWTNYVNGPGGLNQWAAFAKAHGKPVVVDEWGATHQPPGWGSHGGEDNPRYIDRLLNWASDNDAAWCNYFEIDNTQTGVRHRLSRPDTLFPRSAERYLARVGELSGGSVA